MIFQYLVALISIFAIYQSYSSYQKNNQTRRTFIFWSIAWLSVILIALVPDVTNHLSKFLNVTRPIDAILYPSIVIIYYLVFLIYTKIENYNKELTRLVRKEALKNIIREN